jgi:hypothetical protein
VTRLYNEKTCSCASANVKRRPCDEKESVVGVQDAQAFATCGVVPTDAIKRTVHLRPVPVAWANRDSLEMKPRPTGTHELCSDAHRSQNGTRLLGCAEHLSAHPFKMRDSQRIAASEQSFMIIAGQREDRSLAALRLGFCSARLLQKQHCPCHMSHNLGHVTQEDSTHRM